MQGTSTRSGSMSHILYMHALPDTSAVVILAYMYAVHQCAQYCQQHYLQCMQCTYYVQCGRVYSSLHLLHHFHYDIQTTCSSLVSSWQCDDVVSSVATTSPPTVWSTSTISTAGSMYTALRVQRTYVQQCAASCQCASTVDVQQVSSSLGVSTWSRYLLLSHPLDVQTTVLIPSYYMQHTCSTYTTFTTYTTTLHVVYMWSSSTMGIRPSLHLYGVQLHGVYVLRHIHQVHSSLHVLHYMYYTCSGVVHDVLLMLVYYIYVQYYCIKVSACSCYVECELSLRQHMHYIYEAHALAGCASYVLETLQYITPLV